MYINNLHGNNRFKFFVMFLPLIFTYVSTQPLPFFSHLTPDVQHLVVGFVSLSERQQGSGSTLQRGEFGLPRQAGANHGWPEQDALPEGRHKGDITVSWQLFASVSQRSQVFLNRKHFNRRPDGFKNKSVIHKWSTNTWCILHLHAGNHQVGVLHSIFSKLCCPLIQTTQVSDVKSFVTGNSLSLRQAVTRFCESWDFFGCLSFTSRMRNSSECQSSSCRFSHTGAKSCWKTELATSWRLPTEW